MKLAEVLEGVDLTGPLPPEWAAIEVRGATFDSRHVSEGFLFFAFPGAKADGRAFARQAVDRGAVAVVSELPPPEDLHERWIRVIHGRRALAVAVRRLAGKPDEKLLLTGVTGTNGKTTTVFAIDAMLRACGRLTGMAGTIVHRAGSREETAVNTTPESAELLRLMRETLDAGGTHFTGEISSHALALGRVYGLDFHTVVFTNLTQDHLDFHGNMDAYFAAKQALFDGAGGAPPRRALINFDDAWGRKLATAPGTERVTFGVGAGAGLRATRIESDFDGLRFVVEHPAGRQEIRSRLCGLINVYNLTAAFGAGLGLGLGPEEAASGLAALQAVPGRFERVDEGQPFLVVVDYAHTPDALVNTLRVARALGPRRVITLFGCGGDRDRTKRPLMGEAAAANSDFVVVTSDNPRGEDPLAIINDALVGLGRHDTPHAAEPDREKAIRLAISEARTGDIVLLAGKGHEPYQVLKDRTIAFDDREVARRVLREYGYRSGEVRS
jgi:UDP-N-acetylmuramoyl-L-alanyl-D-glutamate--2,6-diaminopimelate ligase